MADDDTKDHAGKKGMNKKQMMIAVGIGLAALVVIYMLSKKSSSNSTAAPISSTVPTGTGVVADGTTPSGNETSADQLSQLMTVAQMLRQQGTTQPGAPPSTVQQAATPTLPYSVHGDQQNGEYDSNALGLATRVYGLKNNTEQDAIIGATAIMNANPQIDWADPIPTGTNVNIPERFIAQAWLSQTTPYNQGDQKYGTSVNGTWQWNSQYPNGVPVTPVNTTVQGTTSLTSQGGSIYAGG
jgi:hypothetical protein